MVIRRTIFPTSKPTTESSTLSLHDALPICAQRGEAGRVLRVGVDGLNRRLPRGQAKQLVERRAEPPNAVLEVREPSGTPLEDFARAARRRLGLDEDHGAEALTESAEPRRQALVEEPLANLGLRGAVLQDREPLPSPRDERLEGRLGKQHVDRQLGPGRAQVIDPQLEEIDPEQATKDAILEHAGRNLVLRRLGQLEVCPATINALPEKVEEIAPVRIAGVERALDAGLGEPARDEVGGLVTALDRRLVGLAELVEGCRRLPEGLVVGGPEQRMANR